MKKPSRPTRPPPPPPLPPKCESPRDCDTRSCVSLPRKAGSCAGGSEYAESSISGFSMPSRLFQTPMRMSPAASSCYQTCKSETGVGHDTFGSYHYYPSYCPSSCNVSDTCCEWRCPCVHSHHPPPPPPPPPPHHSHHAMHCPSSLTPTFNHIRSHSPCSANSHCHQSHHNLTNNSSIQNHGAVCSPIQPTVQPPQPRPVPPTPMARTSTVSRPRIAISPTPVLKNKQHPNNIKYHRKCESLDYRRHIERHVQKIFKYLEDREQRRQKCLEELDGIDPQNAKTFTNVLKQKETLYLRSLRIRISKEDFQEIQQLGAGFIGNVWLVKKIPHDELADKPGKLYAMKKLKISQVVQQNHLAHVMAERDILAEADNEWIVKLYYSFQDSHYLYFVMDYIPGGDMMNLLCKQRVFPEAWARFYIAEISLALEFVHSMDFTHRDIKPDNILIDKKGHIKLTDFGLCTGNRWTHDSRYYRKDAHNTIVQYDDTYNDENNGFKDHPTITKALTKRELEHSSRKRALSLVGSPNYIAPEVLRRAFCQQEGVSERLCDWWSVGVILYEMIMGYCPFIDLQMLKQGRYDPDEDPPQHIQERILNWSKYLAFPSANDHNSPPLTSDADGIIRPVQESTKDLIKGLLCEPQDRLCQNGISDIKGHPFFEGIDWDNIRLTEAPYVPKLRDEYDTTHFDQGSQPFAPESHFNSGTASKMPIADFTYKSYWQSARPPI